MAHIPPEHTLLRALRGVPDRRLDELADLVGLPRTTFGRALTGRIHKPLEDLLDDGLVAEHHGRYRLTDRGRRTLAERALDSQP